jgi:hypothetical protein
MDAKIEIGGKDNDKLLLHYPALAQGTAYVPPVVALTSRAEYSCIKRPKTSAWYCGESTGAPVPDSSPAPPWMPGASLSS